eukprot:symbB.v1.2.021526.t1/scaffold1865.1/size98072/3
MNGSANHPEDRLETFRQTLRASWSDNQNSLPTARVYHRRQVGKLFFFDTLMVDPLTGESFLVELVTCHDSGRCRDGFETYLEDGVALKDLRPGDVLETLAAGMQRKVPVANGDMVTVPLVCIPMKISNHMCTFGLKRKSLRPSDFAMDAS